MTVYKIYPKGFAANSYLLTADGKTAVCVDPAQPRILREAEARGLSVKYVLLTHGHFDHIGGCAALQAAGAEIGCLAEEKPLALGKNNMAETFGFGPVPPFTVGFTFHGGDSLELCGIKFTVIATPGHTAGGACFLAENLLFTGDTLFEGGGAGRTDLPTGDGVALEESLRKLLATDGDFKVYAGHGEDTTIRDERRYYRW